MAPSPFPSPSNISSTAFTTKPITPAAQVVDPQSPEAPNGSSTPGQVAKKSSVSAPVVANIIVEVRVGGEHVIMEKPSTQAIPIPIKCACAHNPILTSASRDFGLLIGFPQSAIDTAPPMSEPSRSTIDVNGNGHELVVGGFGSDEETEWFAERAADEQGNLVEEAVTSGHRRELRKACDESILPPLPTSSIFCTGALLIK
ncbi:hypothetical protein DL93DRAFT_2094576 [Clavulina sp. PMI_390]|nr:hypothetical protein DL93DRAFT_2094576 [Clavulina sp. PMI_390]